jgi:hypothetical protein
MLIISRTSANFTSFLAFALAQHFKEQWIENPRVGGSIPPLGTIYNALVRSFTHRQIVLIALWARVLVCS